MKIVSYTLDGATGYGIVTKPEAPAGPAVMPVGGELASRYPTLRTVLAADALPELQRWAEGRAPTLSLDEIAYLPPLHDAGKNICIGVNYPKRHPVDGDVPPPEHIFIFSKFPGALVGHRETLQVPPTPADETFDYEGELVLVIGKAGRSISKERAFDNIAGYTIMNDGSVREWQKHSVPAGKNFHASGSCGPWMVTADEIADPFAMKLSTRLNGEQVQSTTAGQMIFDIPTLVAYVSNIMPLEPGDIISTGSPDGAGGSRIPQRFLKPGDKLEISWSGIGVLENVVGDRSDR